MILILTEVGGQPLGPRQDFTVYLNSEHVISWTSAAAPLGSTAIELVGREYPLFVRESPRQIWDLFSSAEVFGDDERGPAELLADAAAYNAYTAWLAR